MVNKNNTEGGDLKDPVNQTPQPVDTTLEAPASDNATPSFTRHKKKLLVLLVFLVLMTGTALAWWSTSKDKNSQPVTTLQAQSEDEPTPAPTKLLYAYSEKSKTHVRELDLESGEKKDLFSFEEWRSFGSDEAQFTIHLDPSIDISPTATTLAYITPKGLYTRGVEAKTSTQIIKATGSTKPDIGTTYTFEPSFAKLEGPTPPFGLLHPLWSLDGKSVSFTIAQYEGSSVNAINVSSKEYADAGDTFRYISTQKLGSKFVINTKNSDFRTMGVLPKYLLTPDSALQSAFFSSDKNNVFAILCPKDLASTGDHTFIAEASSDGLSDGTDCGEPQDKIIVSIDLSDGSYRKIIAGKYGLNMNVINKTAYVVLANNKHVGMVDLDSGDSTNIDVLKIGKVDSSAKLLGIEVFGRLNSFAVVYHQSGQDYSATVVDLDTKKLLQRFDIDRLSGFTPLALR